MKLLFASFVFIVCFYSAHSMEFLRFEVPQIKSFSYQHALHELQEMEIESAASQQIIMFHKLPKKRHSVKSKRNSDLFSLAIKQNNQTKDRVGQIIYNPSDYQSKNNGQLFESLLLVLQYAKDANLDHAIAIVGLAEKHLFERVGFRQLHPKKSTSSNATLSCQAGKPIIDE